MAGNFDGIKQRKFGVEIEMTGLTRCSAAKAIQKVLGGSIDHVGGTYDKYTVVDSKGRKWQIVYDSSIFARKKNGCSASDLYKVEMNSPILEFEDLDMLQQVIRALREAGAITGPDYDCGTHIHIDASDYTPQQIKILLDDSEFHDAGKAIRLLEENADRNSWCSYLLGKLQLFGTDEIEQDKENAKEMLKKSTNDGNEYAEALYRQADDYEHSMMTGTVFSLFTHLARIIRDDDLRLRSSNQPKVDRKLRREIEQKKENLGIKMDNSIHIEY